MARDQKDYCGVREAAGASGWTAYECLRIRLCREHNKRWGTGLGQKLSDKSDPVPALTQPDFLKDMNNECHSKLGVTNPKQDKSQGTGILEVWILIPYFSMT